MMQLTDAQIRTYDHLARKYGEPTQAKIEHTERHEGLLWMKWESGVVLGYDLEDRNLFIKPDGMRLGWLPL